MVGGCSSAPKPVDPCKEPEPLRLVLRGTERLNPGDKGEALATVVRVYQLKSSNKISEASFEEVLDKDKEVLADDLLGVDEVTLHPSERLDSPLARKDGAQYLAVVGLFRQPAGTSWRVLYHLPTPDPQHCHKRASAVVQMVLEENRVELR
jgi:type VI secretion system protein VasD